MNAVLIFALIVGPMTALLIWVVISELRGVPAFADGSRPQPDELDTMGRWILGAVCIILAGSAYVYGGAVAVLGLTSFIAALATVIASVWTVGQSAKHWSDIRNGVQTPQALRPFHQRFALNFRRTIIELPVSFVAYG